MATARPFAYNTGTTIDGTVQVGNLAVGVPTFGFQSTGLKWWNGPDEDLGYVIAKEIPLGNQPNQLGEPAYVGFNRSSNLTEQSFIEVSSIVSGGLIFVSGDAASTWLTDNGYWNSWLSITPTPTQTLTPTVTPTVTNTPTPSSTTSSGGIVQSSLFMELDASNYVSGLWTDETGNGNNATINGATWLSTDGGIFDLDGLNDTISIPHNSSLSLSTTQQRTIQVWVKFDNLPSLNAQGQPVFGKLSSSSGFDGYWGGLYSNAGNTRVVTNGTAIQKVTDSTTNPISINTWYLYTFISQITSTSNTTKVYINTTEVSSTQHGSDGYTETNPLYLGYIGNGVGSPYLNGKIGACYFYTKGLTSAEVSQNYNATKSKYGLT